MSDEDLDEQFDEVEDCKYNPSNTYVYMKSIKKVSLYGKQCGNSAKIIIDGKYTDDEIRDLCNKIYLLLGGEK